MKNMKVWPHLTIVAIVCALLSCVGVALWMKHERDVSAQTLPYVARIQTVDGQVGLDNDVNGQDANGNDWVSATPNQPFSVGDRIYTRDSAHAGLAFSGRNFARLNPNSSLDVISLADRRTQLALRDGSAIFDVGYLAPGELFEVGTPYGAVDLNQPGLYNIGIDNGSTIISVLSGLAQVVGYGGSGQISKGEMLTLLGQSAADIVLSRINNRDAGYLIDDYYGYQYPQLYDGRYRNYDVYLNDPYYYDPYRRNISYQYVSSYVPGIDDLDYYGNWYNVPGYGYSWRPRVESGWSPYEQGYWMPDYPYGPTWVSSEPWGYAPYHYGRWAFLNNQWYWIPDAANSTPTYSPALVAFVPLTQTDEIGWVPLGPGDAYPTRYYDQNWQPHYTNRFTEAQTRLINLDVPGAVTIVPLQDFTRVVDRGRFRKADRQMLTQVRPVLDPLSVTPLRNAVIYSAWGRGKISLPPGIRKELQDTPVLTSVTPPEPGFRKNLARDLRVQSVPDRARNEKLKFKDERNRGDQTPDQVTEPFARDKGQQLHQREQSRRRELQSSQTAQGERVSKPARPMQPEFRGDQVERAGQKGAAKVLRRNERLTGGSPPQQERMRVRENGGQEKKAERPTFSGAAAPEPMRVRENRGQAKKAERPASSEAGPRQQPSKSERKQESQNSQPSGHGGGKGHGKRP